MDARTQRMHTFMEKFMNLKLVMRRNQKNERGGPKHLLVVIHSIGDGDPIMVSALSQKLEISNAAATQLVDTLEKHGWIKRVQDEHDRRVTLIALTEDGNVALKEHFIKMSKFVDGMIEYLGEEDATHIERILDKLMAYALSASEQQSGL